MPSLHIWARRGGVCSVRSQNPIVAGNLCEFLHGIMNVVNRCIDVMKKVVHLQLVQKISDKKIWKHHG